jgi:hypothetical protein
MSSGIASPVSSTESAIPGSGSRHPRARRKAIWSSAKGFFVRFTVTTQGWRRWEDRWRCGSRSGFGRRRRLQWPTLNRLLQVPAEREDDDDANHDGKKEKEEVEEEELDKGRCRRRPRARRAPRLPLALQPPPPPRRCRRRCFRRRSSVSFVFLGEALPSSSSSALPPPVPGKLPNTLKFLQPLRWQESYGTGSSCHAPHNQQNNEGLLRVGPLLQRRYPTLTHRHRCNFSNCPRLCDDTIVVQANRRDSHSAYFCNVDHCLEALRQVKVSNWKEWARGSLSSGGHYLSPFTMRPSTN